MGEEKKDVYTSAQQQIERLMNLKLEKDKKDKMRMDNNEQSAPPAVTAEKLDVLKRENAETAKPVKMAAVKKTANSIKMEKRLYEKLHKLVNSLNAAGGEKITKSRFVNTLLKEFLALNIDYSVIRNSDAVKKMFERLKTGN
jgi:hypothetical protein